MAHKFKKVFVSPNSFAAQIGFLTNGVQDLQPVALIAKTQLNVKTVKKFIILRSLKDLFTIILPIIKAVFILENFYDLIRLS